MSLRTFHLFFITLSTLMCVASAILIGVVAQGEPWAVPGIIAAVAASVGLILYGRAFVRRYRNLLPRA